MIVQLSFAGWDLKEILINVQLIVSFYLYFLLFVKALEFLTLSLLH